MTILAYHGHRLLEASDGRAGLAVARADHPDLVITDVLMPVMDGFELVKQLGLDPSTRDIPVVFCTAHYAARDARALALAGGVPEVLTKPIEAAVLMTTVVRALAGHTAAEPAEARPIRALGYDDEHLRLVTDKLSNTTEHLQAANARLAGLINIGLDIASEQDSDRLLAMVCDAARQLFSASSATLGMVDRTGAVVQRLVSSGGAPGTRIQPGHIVNGTLHTVVSERRTVRLDSLGGEPEPAGQPEPRPAVPAFLIAPVASAARVHGWISLVGQGSGSFTHDDERLLGALGGQVGRTYELAHLSQHDYLTGLPNRMLLLDRIAQAIASAQRNQHRLAVLLLDLDRFKRVNDSLGHLKGDEVLQAVADRLLTCLRSSDTVSRLGGDEFVVLLPVIGHAEDAARAARTIELGLAPPHEAEHQPLHLITTIGISIYPDDAITGEALIRCADLAMYQAKNTDGQRYRFFEPRMNDRAVERQRIEAGLHRAIDRREFVLHYQPRIDLHTGIVAGAEALVRWMHPERGLTLPGHFVTVAADCGLMVPIGRWVLEEACTQARAWMDEGRDPITVGVNISAVELRDPAFLAHVAAVLHERGLDPCWLELELTESALMQDVASTAVALQTLKDMGVQLAIDDFGTGYSSLSYLRTFPVAALKIDQSFVRGITADPVDTAIVRAVISLGKSLGHRVVAEGVETAGELAFLKDHRCDEAQGYYFGKPVAPDDFGAVRRH